MSGGNEERGQAIEIYRPERGDIELRVRLEGDIVWLSQSHMALLFGRDRTVITRHINNCYEEGELDRNITCAKFAHVGVRQAKCMRRHSTISMSSSPWATG